MDSYLDSVIRKNPANSLKIDVFYNLTLELYKYYGYDLGLCVDMLKEELVFPKKTNFKPVSFYCLESLSTFYAFKNESQKTLNCLDEMGKIGSKIPENIFINITFQASIARIYSLIGDFERSIFILNQANTDIDNYISNYPELPNDIVQELKCEKKDNFIHLAKSYNFQNQLDLASLCIQSAKALEKKGYNKFNNNIWMQEAFHLILSKKYDRAISVVAIADKKGYIDNKNKRYKALYFLAASLYWKKEYAASLSYCEQAIAIDVKIASFMNFELEVYNLAGLNAEKLQHTNRQIYYSKKYSEIFHKYNYDENSLFIANLYNQDISSAKHELRSQKSDKNIFAMFFLFMAILSFYLLWHYIKLRKDRKKFEVITSPIKYKEAGDDQAQNNKDIGVNQIALSTTKKPVKLSSEVDERIIKQLARFEKKEKFISQNISLNNMASDFNTNSVYLSAVIKNHKGKYFNKYINDLRIEYIIMKLKTSPEYSNYKIAYLAEECGFSSHTVFIRIFTESTGLTPSKFLNFLKKEQAELQINNVK